MKITNKTLQILSGLFILAGVIIELVTRKYNTNNPDDPNTYGKWIGIGIMIIGLILLMPWGKNKGRNNSNRSGQGII